jgi:coenzyme F420-reducing hydrogenase beta subunit
MTTPRISPSEIIRSGLCIGCGMCAAQGSGLDMRLDAYGQLKPSGSSNALTTKSQRLALMCPFSPYAANEDELADELFAETPFRHSSSGRYINAYVGHASDGFRDGGSSGGLTTWLLTELLREKMIDAVAHVAPVEVLKTGRCFSYRISQTEDEIAGGAKSRYYPIEMSAVLEEIRNKPGKYAVVGIPCFIKAVQLLRRHDPLFRERIRFTLGLFCGHMKSSRFLESIAMQMNVAKQDVAAFDFRTKDPNKPANWYRAELRARDGRTLQKDWWHLADGDWGAGFFMNSACNYCDDVVAETADVSFGDAWVEPYSSDWRGTNVVIVRHAQVQSIVERAIADRRLQLREVDGEFIQETQAAGLRQRREGLAYRLTRYKTFPLPAAKRTMPSVDSVALRRRMIYQIRHWISKWSHPVFRFSVFIGVRRVYLVWASVAAYLYHSVTYHRGRLGRMLNWLDKILELYGLRA